MDPLELCQTKRKHYFQRRSKVYIKVSFYLLISAFVMLSVTVDVLHNYRYLTGRRSANQVASIEIAKVSLEEVNSTGRRFEEEEKLSPLSRIAVIKIIDASPGARRINVDPIIDKWPRMLAEKTNDIVDGDNGLFTLPKKSNDIIDGDNRPFELPMKSNDAVDAEKGSLELPPNGNDIVYGEKMSLTLTMKGNDIVDGDTGTLKYSNDIVHGEKELLRFQTKGNDIADGNNGLLEQPRKSNEIVDEEARSPKLPTKGNDIVDGNNGLLEHPRKSNDIVDGETRSLKLSTKGNDIVDGDKKLFEQPRKSNDNVDGEKRSLKLLTKDNDIVDGEKKLFEPPRKRNDIVDGETRSHKLSAKGIDIVDGDIRTITYNNDIIHRDNGVLKSPKKSNDIVDGKRRSLKLPSKDKDVRNGEKGSLKLSSKAIIDGDKGLLKLQSKSNGIVDGSDDSNSATRFRLTPPTTLDCRREPPFLLVFVFSSPANCERRDVIRKMWAKYRASLTVSVRVLFVLGRDADEDDDVRFESDAYGDVIQTELNDVYVNLVRKVYAAFNWTTDNCVARDVGYVLKLDDDVFVDVRALVTYLLRIDALKRSSYNVTNTPPKAEFHCNVVPKFVPYRDGKYAVSRREYHLDLYPPFCTGPAYLMTGRTVEGLMSIARLMGERFFRLEDVFFTGILGDRLGARFVKLNRRYVSASKTEEEFLKGRPGKFLFYHAFPPTRYNFRNWLVVHRKLFARYQKWDSELLKSRPRAYRIRKS